MTNLERIQHMTSEEMADEYLAAFVDCKVDCVGCKEEGCRQCIIDYLNEEADKIN